MSLDVVAYVPYPRAGASSRYRVYQFVDRLAELGIRLDVRPFHDDATFARLYQPGRLPGKMIDFTRGAVRRWRGLDAAGRYDACFVHRELWPFVGQVALERLIARQPRCVYDFDDAMFLPNVSPAHRTFARLKPTDQCEWFVRRARGVAAGNAWLAEWSRARRPNASAESVEVIPTAVDTIAWAPKARRSSGPPRLVWIGSHTTVHYLEPLKPALRRLAGEHPGLELHVIGGRFEASGVRVIEHEWKLEDEVAQVASCDIGLAPLPDDDWSRGKCGLKLLLYMSLGLPAVASPVGVNLEMVRDGDNGRLATSPDDFATAISALMASPAERARMGDAARATVERCYSVDAIVPRLAALIRRAAEA